MQAVDDSHVIMAKEMLKTNGKGYVVEAIENHYELSDFVTSFKDSSKFSEAYVDDMLDCLNVAYEQNVKILNEHNLADCLN